MLGCLAGSQEVDLGAWGALWTQLPFLAGSQDVGLGVRRAEPEQVNMKVYSMSPISLPGSFQATPQHHFGSLASR